MSQKEIMSRTLFSRAPFALAAFAALLAGMPAAQSQDVFITTDTTLDSANPVNGSARIGVDSSGSSLDGLGNPYSPSVGLIPGGSVAQEVTVVNSSVFTMAGGSVQLGVSALDTSSIFVSDGVVGGNVFAFNESDVTLSGGSFGADVNASNDSSLTFSGGSIVGSLLANNNSLISVYGGSINGDIAAFDTTEIDILGGSAGGSLYAFGDSSLFYGGGSFGQFFGSNVILSDNSALTIIGSDLSLTDLGADPNLGGEDFALSGTLLDGTRLDGYVLNQADGFTGSIALVPEPGVSTLCAGMFLSGAGLLARRKRMHLTA